MFITSASISYMKAWTESNLSSAPGKGAFMHTIMLPPQAFMDSVLFYWNGLSEHKLCRHQRRSYLEKEPILVRFTLKFLNFLPLNMLGLLISSIVRCIPYFLFPILYFHFLFILLRLIEALICFICVLKKHFIFPSILKFYPLFFFKLFILE